ncbi:hypothetical protein SAMN06269185_0887 [Natronoarchaeum philippinense]|uniref:Uncharacterized protein n=1 Tax=Natronoarchaeum philippinense TaxID=558529 RepID=A0A285N7S8_NATPI|nr:hypothetical protein [Natronoarchaeum philippinense]SNZ05544.1 hypothetical protein SAMN06269185_0887 [Natronoarchaeum philippinense]
MTGPERDGLFASIRSDADGSIPLRVAPMLMLGLSILVLVILYVTTA